MVSIDYRLAPETKLPEILEDVRDAYQWVREKGPELFWIDPDRIALVGNSAGGYLALMAGFSVTPRPKALVSFYGYGDITRAWTTRPDPHYLTLERVTKEDADKAVGGKVLSESPIFPRVLFYNYTRQHGLWPREVAALDPDKEPREARAVFSDPPRHQGVSADAPSPRRQGHRCSIRGVGANGGGLEQSWRRASAHPNAQLRSLVRRFPQGLDEPDAEPLGLKDRKVSAAYDVVVAFLRKHAGR